MLDLKGEAAPGVPMARAELTGGALTVLTKSGGFGGADPLVRLLWALRGA